MSTPEPYCKNCLLYNNPKGICSVALLINGEQIHVPVDPEDYCFFEQEQTVMNEQGEEETYKLTDDMKYVRWFVAKDETGKSSVKIEYPEDFFGNQDANNI